MTQEYIEIRGARENNLKNVSLRIPKRKITIFTGVSGSGKSSIVFDTIAAEARRQLNETFSTFVRNFLPRYTQPEADAIENLSMAIVVDQKHLGGGSHSTVGTITDIYSVLRLLYSRIGRPFVGNSNAFSFNDPRGMCPECNGIGRKIGVDLDVIKVADHVVDVGPFAGTRDGTIVFEGSFADLLNADTLTGRHLKQSMPVKSSCRAAKGKLPITNARANNLQNVSVDIPTGILTVVTGVAGSG